MRSYGVHVGIPVPFGLFFTFQGTLYLGTLLLGVLLDLPETIMWGL